MSKRFEYREELHKDGIDSMQSLNEMGGDGWELVVYLTPIPPSFPGAYIFKREIVLDCHRERKF